MKHFIIVNQDGSIALYFIGISPFQGILNMTDDQEIIEVNPLQGDISSLYYDRKLNQVVSK